jgi:hypothetical protein
MARARRERSIRQLPADAGQPATGRAQLPQRLP